MKVSYEINENVKRDLDRSADELGLTVRDYHEWRRHRTGLFLLFFTSIYVGLIIGVILGKTFG